MNQLQFTKDELALILDGLAMLPLARSYNLFQKMLPLVNAPPQEQQELPLTPPAINGSGDQAH